jgi:DNA mismatch repair protein MSH4
MANDADYHPNDTYLCRTSNLAIVTGPNMSGKSTYLRQIGLIVIMAQAGSFVPASFMSFSPFHSVGTHAVSTGASAAHDTSNFMAEMMQTAQIFRQHLPRALVLMDELGRSTSTTDGLALSVAVAEQLLASDAMSIFTTHFPAMAELPLVQSRCKIWFAAPFIPEPQQ